MGGKFVTRMEERNGAAGFDFEGTYTEVKDHELVAYTLEDGRTVRVTFEETGGATTVSTTFDTEGETSPEQQKEGWQSILGNFKRHCEKTS